jgi:cytoskeletal protein RodZ
MSVFTKKNKPVNNNGAEQLPKKSDIGAKPERPKTAGGRKKILLVVGLILLVLAVGGGVYVWQRPSKKTPAGGPTFKQTPEQAAAQKAYDQAVKNRDTTKPPEGQAKSGTSATVSQPATGPNNAQPKAAAAKATLR